MKLMIHLTPVEAIFEAEIWVEAGKVLKKEEKEEKEENKSGWAGPHSSSKFFKFQPDAKYSTVK